MPGQQVLLLAKKLVELPGFKQKIPALFLAGIFCNLLLQVSDISPGAPSCQSNT